MSQEFITCAVKPTGERIIEGFLQRLTIKILKPDDQCFKMYRSSGFCYNTSQLRRIAPYDTLSSPEAPKYVSILQPIHELYISYDEDKLYADLKTIFIDVDDFVWILNS